METKNLPERDQSAPAEQQGLFRKFNVSRTDGSDVAGGKHFGCRYFVLDLTHDQHAPAAMRAYAKACAPTHPKLAADLAAEFPRAQAPHKPLAIGEAFEQVGGHWTGSDNLCPTFGSPEALRVFVVKMQNDVVKALSADNPDARDAARYRWLCDNNFDKVGVTQIQTWLHTWEPHSETGEPTQWKQRVRGGKLDLAIDKAMQGDVPAVEPAGA